MRNWILSEVVPRLIFPVYWMALILGFPFMLLGLHAHRANRNRKPKLLIESGIRGWDGIFIQEVHTSAEEYLGSKSVKISKIDRAESYIRQFRATLKAVRPTHFFFDPRTTNSHAMSAMIEAFMVALHLLWYGVVPIVFLTDASCRSWRIQSAVVSVWRGVVATCISTRDIGSIFPHRRISGPVLMPVSARTLEEVRALKNLTQPIGHTPIVRFVGLAYSPRIEWLLELETKLAERGIRFEIYGNKAETSNEEYWKLLCDADILVTTTMQQPQPHYDWVWKSQVVFRFMEAIVAGSTLVAEEVTGLNRYLIPGVHYVSYRSVADCAQSIVDLMGDQRARTTVARKGHERASEIVSSRAFWMMVDSALGPNSMI